MCCIIKFYKMCTWYAAKWMDLGHFMYSLYNISCSLKPLIKSQENVYTNIHYT